MPTSCVTDILRANRAVFLIAALITSLAIQPRAAEGTPPKPDPAFKDYTGIVSEEATHRFDQELAQFERKTADRVVVAGFPKMQSGIADYTQRLAQRGGVSQNDRRGEHQTTGRTLKPNHSRIHLPLSLWLFLVFVIAAIVISRIRPRRRYYERNGKRFPSYYPLRIAIEFKSGGAKPPQQLDGWQASLEGGARQLAPLRLLPLFESHGSIDQLVARARRNDPNYEPPDFSASFQVETPAGVKADELVKRLRKLDNVETAYVIRPNPPPVPVNFTNNPRNLKQGYQDAAPKGIHARYAWGFLGGDGAGIGFVDLEQGWNLDHRDLKDAMITIISGVNRWDYSHGTSVLGEVLMVDNTLGGVGIAPSCKGRVISLWRTDSSPNTADAIRGAIATMSFGDVLLLEVQETDPVSDTDYWPAEILQSNYNAIHLATAMGVVVVEAAGNGGYDLDPYTNAKGRNIFDRRHRDSRAIIVGAGSSEDSHAKLPFSNYGKRVDCYAWGENINTATTSDTGGSNTEYTTRFDGTSGAAAIVAGAALIVQGIAQFSLGRRLSPLEVRDLLTTDGTPSATPASDKIGVMPDLKKIITANQIKLKPVPIPTSGLS